jgi:ParB/RepB/Spo0J family partition protein
MELRIVNPRVLLKNGCNPRRTKSSESDDALLQASVEKIGFLYPPIVRQHADGKFEIKDGSRRVRCAIGLKLKEILILVMDDDQDISSDSMRSLAANVARSPMQPVDMWRHMETLISQGWTVAAVASAFALTDRAIQQYLKLGQILPAMLEHMATGDMPNGNQLGIIASATQEEQEQGWKKAKPRKGHQADWQAISSCLVKTRFLAVDAKFGDDLATAYGIIWEEDLFASANTDSRSTSQTDAFLGAQLEWMRSMLPEKGIIVAADRYGQITLPKGAHRLWDGGTHPNEHTAWSICPRNGKVTSTRYYVLETARRSSPERADAGARVIRAPITQRGISQIGTYRTAALQQALKENLITDIMMIGLLLLAIAGNNVQIDSHYTGRRELLNRIAANGNLVQDAELLRAVAREILAETLSLEEGRTNSGAAAMLAGLALGADAYLPDMATEEFLPTLSKPALNALAEANEIIPGARAKDTRAAILSAFQGRVLIIPEARFTEPKIVTDRSLEDDGVSEIVEIGSDYHEDYDDTAAEAA